jgi:hypothetical protein
MFGSDAVLTAPGFVCVEMQRLTRSPSAKSPELCARCRLFLLERREKREMRFVSANPKLIYWKNRVADKQLSPSTCTLPSNVFESHLDIF